MGTVTGILPFAYLIAKPLFGFLVDLYRDYRKVIFMGLIITMASCYSFITTIPKRENIEFVISESNLIETCVDSVSGN